MAVSTISTVDDLVATLSAGAAHSTGPGTSIDLLDHSLQTAYEAYVARPHDDELHVAALVHDLGLFLAAHPSNGGPTVDPCWLGAVAIRGLLGRRVGDLVARHGLARRYRLTVGGTGLTPEQRDWLAANGGPLSPSQIRKFERQRNIVDVMVLDEADELGRQYGRIVPSLASWRPVLDAVAGATAREREITIRSMEMSILPY